MEWKKFILRNIILDLRDQNRELMRPVYREIINKNRHIIDQNLKLLKEQGVDFGNPSNYELLKIVMEK